MDPITLTLGIVAGLIAGLACGAISGLKVGGEALGSELAAYMGGLYGLVASCFTTLIGIVALVLIS